MNYIASNDFIIRVFRSNKAGSPINSNLDSSDWFQNYFVGGTNLGASGHITSGTWPLGVTGDIWLMNIPFSASYMVSGGWVCQVIFHAMNNQLWQRYALGTTWQAWQRQAVPGDLASYLPLAGGTMTGGLSTATSNIDINSTGDQNGNTALMVNAPQSPANAVPAIMFHKANNFWGFLAMSNGRFHYKNNGSGAARALAFVDEIPSGTTISSIRNVANDNDIVAAYRTLGMGKTGTYNIEGIGSDSFAGIKASGSMYGVVTIKSREAAAYGFFAEIELILSNYTASSRPRKFFRSWFNENWTDPYWVEVPQGAVVVNEAVNLNTMYQKYTNGTFLLTEAITNLPSGASPWMIVEQSVFIAYNNLRIQQKLYRDNNAAVEWTRIGHSDDNWSDPSKITWTEMQSRPSWYPLEASKETTTMSGNNIQNGKPSIIRWEIRAKTNKYLLIKDSMYSEGEIVLVRCWLGSNIDLSTGGVTGKIYNSRGVDQYDVLITNVNFTNTNCIERVYVLVKGSSKLELDHVYFPN
jgi:hypothetical protein